MTLEELFRLYRRDYMELNLTPNTIRGYMVNIRHVLSVLPDRETGSLTYDDLDDLVRQLRERQLSNTSIIYVLATLRGALGFAVRHGWLSGNIVSDYIKPRKEIFHTTVWSLDEIGRFLSATKDSSFWPAFLLAGMFGLRRGEVCGLKSGDIRPDRLLIRRSVTVINGRRVVTDTKSHRERDILIPQSVRSALKLYDSERPPCPEGYLLRSSDGRALNPNSLGRALHRFAREFELPLIRFHDLRHSYATAMMEQDVHPKIIQQVLGHSSVKVTLDRYSHANIRMQKACLQVLEGVKF